MNGFDIAVHAKTRTKNHFGILTQLSIFVLILIRLNPDLSSTGYLWYCAVVFSSVVMILGISGLIDKVMKWMPIPIVMGMIVGVMIKFAIEMVTSITISPLLAGSAIGAFFVLIIGMSGVSSFHINAPLWAIIGGLLVSFLIEKEH